MNYFRVYMKNLYVGIGVYAERMEVDDTNVFFWGRDGRMSASFWLEDIVKVEDVNRKVLLEVAAPLPTQPMATAQDIVDALRASLQIAE